MNNYIEIGSIYSIYDRNEDILYFKVINLLLNYYKFIDNL